MVTFTQLIVSGLLLGGIYALIALGFVIIYKASGVLNLAQGSLLMLGSYFCFATLVQWQLPLGFALLLAMVFAIVTGLLLERSCIRPLIGQPIVSAVMVTIALWAALDGLVLLIWGPVPEAYPEIFPLKVMRLGEIVFSQQLVLSFIIAMAAVILFALYFTYTRSGLSMRAVAEDHQAARGAGIKVAQILSLTWVIAAVIAAIGGFLLGSINGVNLNLSFLALKALPVVLLAGLESIPGAVVGGLIIGILEQLAGGYIDPLIAAQGILGGGVREIFPFVIMIVILLIRPYGLFGLRRIERV